MITGDTFNQLFQCILSLFLMMIPGFLLRKMHIGDDKLAKGISNIVIYFSTPAMLVNGFLRDFSTEILINLLQVFVLSFLAHAVAALIGYACWRKGGKIKEDIVNVLRFATVFSNAGYMGIPLLSLVFGGEAAIYASVYLIWFYVFEWTLGCLIYTGDKKYMTLKKAIVNSSVIPILIGLVLFFFSLSRYIPLAVTNAVSSLSGTVAPLSMMLIGFRLAEVDFRSALKNRYLYLESLVRLLLCPVAIWGLMVLAQLLGIQLTELSMNVVLICAATPSAVTSAMFAEMFDGNVTFASQIVSAATLFSLITIPGVAALLLIPIPSLFG